MKLAGAAVYTSLFRPTLVKERTDCVLLCIALIEANPSMN
jgi:hypothetical protein